jgi:glycosyltransferase involved in cell wall biosynthesis
VAKAARAPASAKHLSYVFTPIRYLWDMYDSYFGRQATAGRLPKLLMPWVAPFFRKWDVRTCQRVDHFFADSDHVRQRIRRYYQREAEVIPVPVDTGRFRIFARPREYYLMVTALAPYKRVDLAVRAFNRLGLPLIIVGTGPLRERLQEESGKNIAWFGWADSEQLKQLYGECRALIFPGEEDAGITPLEAQASGRPVVAYGVGGVLETVVPWSDFQSGQNDFFGGVFFYRQTEEALIEAVRTLEGQLHAIQPEKLREYARTFDREVFKERMKRKILEKMERGS